MIMILRNFKKYEPEIKAYGEDAVYLIDEKGNDWYQSQPSFSENSLKFTFDHDGLITSQSFDVSALFPIEMSVAEIKTTLPDVTGFYFIGDQLITENRPSKKHHWNGTEWILDETQKAEFKRTMQETMRAKIVAKRDEMLNGGVFIPEFGKTVDTDATALSNYVQMKADFDLNGVDNEYVLIFSDFSFKAISFDEFKILWNAVKTHKERCYENATMHITLMLQADEPEKYDFSEFWQGEPHEKAK